MHNTKGFTMMELLVTVLLIGILAAMAMPQYMKVVEKQKGTEAVNILAVIGKAQERYFAVNEEYTTDLSDLDSDLVDFETKAPAKGNSYNTKYFVFLLEGTEDKISKVKATRRGNESYILERDYTTGKLCCKNDNTADGDICDVLDLSDSTCDSATEDPSNPPQPPVSTCSGAQPASSQACASGCGTQTRSVTCNNGTWTTSSWTGTCTSPTQTQPTSQTCGTNGTQTRTCTASCNGGSCGAWTTCVVTTCTGAQPAQSQACTNCGTQTRNVTCDTTTGNWVAGQWSSCVGSKTIGDTCGEGYAGNKTRTCTNDVWGNWDSSGCVALVCPIGTTVVETCPNNTTTHSRTMQSNGSWSAWSSC